MTVFVGPQFDPQSGTFSDHVEEEQTQTTTLALHAGFGRRLGKSYLRPISGGTSSASGVLLETARAIASEIECPRSAWAVFESRAFTRIWGAAVLGMTGISMSDAASAWLMTGMNADPRAFPGGRAAFLPMFLVTVPAGALVDIVEPKRFLLYLETAITVIVVGFAAIVSLNLVTPSALLALTFLLSAAWSVAAPAWAALTPILVPRGDLELASAVNSVGYNMSCAIGPAIGGRLISSVGIAAPFWGFALANAMSVLALLAGARQRAASGRSRRASAQRRACGR